MQKSNRTRRVRYVSGALALALLAPLTACSADTSTDLTACKKLAGYWNDGFSSTASADAASEAQRTIRALGESTPTELGTHITNMVLAWESSDSFPDDDTLRSIQFTCSDLGIEIPMGF